MHAVKTKVAIALDSVVKCSERCVEYVCTNATIHPNYHHDCIR